MQKTPEADLYDQIRLAASGIGVQLFRNNVGVFRAQGKAERWIRTGLCAGSSDLVGWRTIQKGGEDVAQFVALEVKTPEYRKRVKATQEDFLKVVRSAGGHAGVVTSVKEAVDFLKQEVTTPA